MHRAKRTLGRLLAATAMAVAITAVAASSASAYGWAFGNFSPNGTYVQQGTLQLSFAGQTKQCTFSSTHSQAVMSGGGACVGGGNLWLSMSEWPVWNGGNPTASFSKWGSSTIPWGTMNAFGFSVQVVNGNQSTPTKLVLNNTDLGTAYSPQYGTANVYATGNITIKTPTGGLVTVTP